MASEFARHTHGVEIPDDDCAINATRGKVVAVAVEAHACRVPGPNCVGDIFRVVLKKVIVRKKKIHVRLDCRLNFDSAGIQEPACCTISRFATAKRK